MTRHDALSARAEAVLDELIRLQEQRRLDATRRIVPHATADDADQPHDFPALASDPHFNYEDGILAGLLAARAALRARVFVDAVGDAGPGGAEQGGTGEGDSDDT